MPRLSLAHTPTGMSGEPEIGADFVLWDGADDIGDVEEKLRVPADLRRRMTQWADEYNDKLNAAVPGKPMWHQRELLDFDRRGYILSLELQQVLGDDYMVEYKFMTSALRAQVTSEATDEGPHPTDTA